MMLYYQDGNSALAWAARKGNMEVCKLLVGRKASVPIKNKVSVDRMHWTMGNFFFDCTFLIVVFSDVVPYL
jgi:ankyrin repeat protein